MAEHGAKWIITITVILCSVIELIDTSIVNVSLPQMMGNLGATLDEIAWVVTAYVVANVIIVPMASWLAAFFGRKNYFVGSIALFTAASFFCGHATNIWELVFFRFLQGVGGGALLSTSQSILVETFPPSELGFATSLFGLGIVVGPTTGPTLGGCIIGAITPGRGSSTRTCRSARWRRSSPSPSSPIRRSTARSVTSTGRASPC